MFTRFEEYAATQMLGQPDSPPRSGGKLFFSEKWQRTVFGMALALSKEGHFEWEHFRQQLMSAIATWEKALKLEDLGPRDKERRRQIGTKLKKAREEVKGGE